ncbi:MAG: hypothetical protein ACLPH5_04600 [Candidatus Sulfotelmatobacter sp.]
MPATIGTTSGLDSALRRAFSEASVRVAPDTRMTDIVTALGVMGVSIEVQDGVLVLQQGATAFNTSLALRNFSQRPEHAKFFILETLDPKTWTNARKMKYIAEHGQDAWGKLCCAPVIEAGIKVLDVNMSKHDYMGLTRSEKIAFLREFGSDAAARIMLRKN